MVARNGGLAHEQALTEEELTNLREIISTLVRGRFSGAHLAEYGVLALRAMTAPELAALANLIARAAPIRARLLTAVLAVTIQHVEQE